MIEKTIDALRKAEGAPKKLSRTEKRKMKKREAEDEASTEAYHKRQAAESKKINRLIKESGVVQDLEKIQAEMLDPQKIRSTLWNKNGTVRLIWGKHFTLDEHGAPHLVVQASPLDRLMGKKAVEYDWNLINVRVNTLRNEIAIGETTVTRPEWKNDRSVITEAIAKAFLHPEKPPHK